MTTTAACAVPFLVAALCATGDLVAHAPAPRPLPDVARPDVVRPEDLSVRWIPYVTRFGLGAYEPVAIRQIEVQKGDTFPSIATKRLGDASRAADIAALNPDVDPTKLKIGAWLWLPLATAPAKSATVYAAFVRDFRGSLEPMREGGKHCDALQSATDVVLAPIDQLAAIQQQKKLPEDAAKAGIVVAPMGAIGARVPKASPARRLEQAWELVTKDGASTMQLVREQFFDVDGKPMDRATAQKPAPQPKQGAAWLLAGMTLGGGLLMRRRRRDGAPA